MWGGWLQRLGSGYKHATGYTCMRACTHRPAPPLLLLLLLLQLLSREDAYTALDEVLSDIIAATSMCSATGSVLVPCVMHGHVQLPLFFSVLEKVHNRKLSPSAFLCSG